MTVDGGVLLSGHDRASHRIAHCGRMGLEEILCGRFAHPKLEPVWTWNYIECVEITSVGLFGVEEKWRILRRCSTRRLP